MERATALRERGALWNTMILVARASALRALYAEHLPALAAAFRAYGITRPEWRRELLARMYRTLEPADFSRDLLARAQGLAVHAWPQEVGWTDVGTPPRLLAWLGADLHAAVAGPPPAAF